MPSFPVTNGNYKHFYCFARHYPYDVFGSRCAVFSKFIWYTAVICLYAVLLILWRLLIDYGYYHNEHLHNSRVIKLIYNTFYMFFLTMINASIIILLACGMARSQICYQLVIGSTIYNKFRQNMSSMLLCLLILTVIGMIPYLCLYFLHYDLAFHVFIPVPSICTILECEYMHLTYVIHHYVIPCTAPTLGVLIWYLISLCFCKTHLEISYNPYHDQTATQTPMVPTRQINHVVDFAKIFKDTITGKRTMTHTDHHYKYTKSKSINAFAKSTHLSPQPHSPYFLLAEPQEHKTIDISDGNLSALSAQFELTPSASETPLSTKRFQSPFVDKIETESTLYSESSESVTYTNSKCPGSVSVCYALCFTSFYALFCGLMGLYKNMKHDVLDEYALVLYVSIRCIICVFQFILTRIGRKCDEFVHRHDRYNCFVSIEFLMEWYCCCTYYVVFRLLTAYHTHSITQYVMFLSIHMVFEIPLSLKISSQYYIITSAFMETMKAKWCRCCLYMFYDDCSLKQWKIRCCMDIVLRFYASILSTLMQTLILVSVSEKDVYLYHTQYHATLGYMLLSNIYEMIHIVLLYMCSEYNVLTPFVDFLNSMTFAHQFIHLNVFISVLVVLLS
eukprot:87019_1